MDMDIKDIKKLILQGKWMLSDHALNRMLQREIRVIDVLTSILNGEILEDYKNDPRGESCLILGHSNGNPIHTVCGFRSECVIIITAYYPEPPRWVNERQRGGKTNE